MRLLARSQCAKLGRSACVGPIRTRGAGHFIQICRQTRANFARPNARSHQSRHPIPLPLPLPVPVTGGRSRVWLAAWRSSPRLITPSARSLARSLGLTGNRWFRARSRIVVAPSSVNSHLMAARSPRFKLAPNWPSTSARQPVRESDKQPAFEPSGERANCHLLIPSWRDARAPSSLEPQATSLELAPKLAATLVTCSSPRPNMFAAASIARQRPMSASGENRRDLRARSPPPSLARLATERPAKRAHSSLLVGQPVAR